MVALLRKTMMVLHRLEGAGVDVGAAMALSGKASEVTVVTAADTEVSPEAGEVTVGLEVVTVVVSGEASEETEGAVEEMEIGEEMVVVGAAVVVVSMIVIIYEACSQNIFLRLSRGATRRPSCIMKFTSAKSARSLAAKVDTNSKFYHPAFDAISLVTISFLMYTAIYFAVPAINSPSSLSLA
jgi:hypothetical protein